MNHCQFFYRPQCAWCYKALEDVAPFFASLRRPLMVRRIGGKFINLVSGLPAIYIPSDVFNTDQAIIVVGADMIRQLEILKESTLSI